MIVLSSMKAGRYEQSNNGPIKVGGDIRRMLSREMDPRTRPTRVERSRGPKAVRIRVLQGYRTQL